jgi:hypothetical protein
MSEQGKRKRSGAKTSIAKFTDFVDFSAKGEKSLKSLFQLLSLSSIVFRQRSPQPLCPRTHGTTFAAEANQRPPVRETQCPPDTSQASRPFAIP